MEMEPQKERMKRLIGEEARAAERERGRLEEREAVAEYLAKRAEDFDGLPVTKMELERLACDIRSGVLRNGQGPLGNPARYPAPCGKRCTEET